MKQDDSITIKYYWPNGNHEFKIDRKHLPYIFVDIRVISLAKREYRAVVKGFQDKLVHESEVLNHSDTEGAMRSIIWNVLAACQEELKRAQV